MNKEELKLCQFSQWYPIFSKNTIKSRTIPLLPDFVRYLKTDGTLVLPKGIKVGGSSNEKDWEEAAWESNDDEVSQPEFPELIEEINEATSELGGKVFPKMNWSAPRDASWVNNNTLKCSSPGEIFLLLKSSDFIQHDLDTVFKIADDDSFENNQHRHELVLRQWANLSPGMEFRCFIRNKQLIGISQREWKQYFQFVEVGAKQLSSEVQSFVANKIIDKFPLSNYAVDVYKKKSGKYWIIDFNPFAETTDPLLFTWNELSEGQLSHCSASIDLLEGDHVVGQFRFASEDTVMQPSDYLSSRLPVDFVDLSTGSDATKLVDFMRMKVQTENDVESTDDEDDQWRLPT